MDWGSSYFQSTFGRIIGNSYHRSTCLGFKDNGTLCQNDVSKESRIDSAIQLGLFRGGPVSLSSEVVLTGAAKSMLCSECRLALKPSSAPDDGFNNGTPRSIKQTLHP
ncbi:unnamed protein product [Penicillium camemberti]|uniref:Str. FM013 n=1 Tax=Penicillium camemberti (strain FM 013) TaxID=1429867 RepID=A0A0G4PX21_PENC3|nr:unnamed protein product [Penicillium camemberti]